MPFDHYVKWSSLNHYFVFQTSFMQSSIVSVFELCSWALRDLDVCKRSLFSNFIHVIHVRHETFYSLLFYSSLCRTLFCICQYSSCRNIFIPHSIFNTNHYFVFNKFHHLETFYSSSPRTLFCIFHIFKFVKTLSVITSDINLYLSHFIISEQFVFPLSSHIMSLIDN